MQRRAVQTTTLTVFFALALAVVLTLPAAAQTDVTTARIMGTVKDPDGAVLPGVTVEAKNQDTGFTVRAFTDGKGGYRLLNLPTGYYTVIAKLEGFAESTNKEIRVVLGSSPTLDISLQLARASDSLTVTGELPLVEVTKTSASTTIQSDQLANIPTAGRDFTNLVLLTPETRKDRERNGLSISGQRGINTNVMVDGVDYNNAFFGGTAGTAEGRAPVTISQESIKEFSVITNGASVEFGRSGGGFVNVITKSGTNLFKGSVFYYTQPNRYVSARTDGSHLEDQSKKQFGGSFGGPIIKDKLFFFTSYDQVKQSFSVALNSGVTTAPGASDFFTKWPQLRSEPSFTRQKDGRSFFSRLDYQLGGSHRVTARMNYTDYDGVNDYYTNKNYSSSYNMLEGLFSRSYVAAYSGTLTDNLLNDTNLQYFLEDTPRGDKNPTLADIRIGSYRYGGVYFAPVKSTSKRKSISDTVSYLKGGHLVKGGFEYNDTSISQTFKGDWRGDYEFAGFKDALAGKWTKYTQFIGLGGLTADQAGTVSMNQKELALFAQDQWFVTQNLTVSLGLRWERQDNPNFPTLNLQDKNANGSYNMTAHIPDQTNQWSPRLGATWSAPNRKTVIRMTAGRYWARTPSILFAQLWSSNGYRGARYVAEAAGTDPHDPNCKLANNKSCYDPLAPGWGDAFTPVGVAPVDSTKITKSFTGLEVYTIDPKFENPRVDRATVGFDQEIFKDTALSVDYTYAKGSHLQRLTDSNIQYDIDPVTGKPKLSPINNMPVFSKTRPNPYYARIVTSKSDATSRYYSLAMTLRRRFTERLYGFAAVTYSMDKDSDSNERNYAGIQLEDVNNLDNNWGFSDRDQRWKIALNGVWNTPWWGFSLSGTYRYNTGQPYTAFLNNDVNSDGNRSTDRPTDMTKGKHFGRNTYREPDNSSLDLRLQKKFSLKPGDILVIVECFNCSNNANEYGPVTTWGSTFGNTTPTNYTRTFQFALRFDF